MFEVINVKKSRFEGKSVKDICSLLEKLGKIEDVELKNELIALTNHENIKVKVLSLKNLAKFSDLELLELFNGMATSSISSEVRREAVSAIGRIRDKSTISTLARLLNDEDPKVVMQAIRGLLVFKKDTQVFDLLERAKDHPNEQISDLLRKELKTPDKKKRTKSEHTNVDLRVKNVAVNGDTVEVMKLLEDETVHLTFTSPPYYNARDYSFYKSYDEYLEFLKIVFKEVHRITKSGRFLVVNTSPIIVPRASRAHASKRYPIPFDLHPLLVNIGWEYIDDIIWVKPEASVKNRIGGFMQHRKPLAYKPNTVTEMLMVYRKKSDDLIDWNIKQYSDEIVSQSLVSDGYESNNVWKIDPTFDKTHSAVFPINLCNKVIQYYSFVGDLIFDPFAGSGTLGKSARNLNRNYFLTEQDEAYFERIKENLRDVGLFENKEATASFLSLEDFRKSLNNET